MAFNWQTFRTRTLTAIIFAAVMLIGLLWNIWSFLILFTIIHFGCWFEYLKLIEKTYSTKINIIIKWLFAICGFTFMLVLGLHNISFGCEIDISGFSIKFKLLFCFFLFVCLMIFLIQNKKIPSKGKRMSFAGLIYISLSLALFLNLRDSTFFTNREFYLLDLGKVYVCTIIFSIWINDTMAYIVGSLLGKNPLSKISPKKTWEGTIGGIILSVTVVGLVSFYSFHLGWLAPHLAIIAAISSIAGTFGDLLESKLKRMAGVKDSGSFMPGHGGFLDRFDSMLLAIPAVWFYVYFFT